MDNARTSPRHGAELRAVAAAASAALGGLPYSSRGSRLDAEVARGGILVLAPFLFAEALPFDGALGAARTMSLGNAFGAAHFLAQDRALDDDEGLDPQACHFSDLTLSLFVREHSRLFDPSSAFWRHFDRYLEEYFESLSWERAVLRTGRGRAAVDPDSLPATLLALGRRLSPLKCSAAGVALLAGREDALGAMEAIVEDYHAAYQLADDLCDLADDVAARRWSVPLWMMAAGLGLAEPPAGETAGGLARMVAESRVLEEAAGLIGDSYSRAADRARDIGAAGLAGTVERARDETLCGLLWNARRALAVLRAGRAGGTPPDAVAAPARADAPPLHAFEVGGEGFVVDPATCLFFRADGPALDVLGLLERGASDSDLSVAAMNHGQAAVREVLDEASAVSPRVAGLPPAVPSPGSVATLALHVSARCNLRCDYCYLGRSDGGLMSEDVALRALDLLLDESFGAPRLSVVFFGGEPLLNLALIERAAAEARRRASAEGRTVSFHLTTNGTLLTPEAAERLSAVGVSVLVSMDGDRAGHDAHRRFENGRGSYDTIAQNLARLPPGFSVAARATVTESSPALPVLVRHLEGLGFATVHLAPVSGGVLRPALVARLCEDYEAVAALELERVSGGGRPLVGNLAESVAALERGAPRRLPCGAGARYLSVAADGTLALCHRFAGDAAFTVGDVAGGFDRAAASMVLAGLAVRTAECARCWARWLCGGPCHYDVAASPDERPGDASGRCRMRRRTLELAMWLHASLPEPVRARLCAQARRALSFPCDGRR